jgi:DeoR/GlpR family transcriptional regulator of sugar metabolism
MNEEIPLGRRDVIAKRLDQGESVVATALAAEFDVSEDAIRRDLRALASEGRCRRVYGGALPVLPTAVPMSARLDKGRDRKHALARRAVPLISRGELVFLDSGSTNLAIVEFLPEDEELVIATNSIDIAAAVLRRSDLKLILIGGEVDPAIGGAVDSSAIAKVSALNIDRSFIGACSVSTTRGLSVFSMADASFKQAVIAASRVVTALVTSEKLEIHAPFRVDTLAAFESLVLEHDVAVEDQERIAQAGTSVLLAAHPVAIK